MDSQICKDEYKIGAVSKITGIGTETLRAWERRYQAIVPSRSESGDRVYSSDDLSKLFLLKNLSDAGNSIGTIARLSLHELKSKWENSVQLSELGSNLGKANDNQQISNSQSCRVLLLGEDFPLRVLDGMSDFNGIELLGHVDSIESWDKTQPNSLVHVAIIERPTINEEVRKYVSTLLKEMGVWHVIVLYGFGSQIEINQLQSPQVSAIRSSIDVHELARLCMDRAGGDSKNLIATQNSTVYLEDSIPTRRYSSKQLGSLARISSSIQCECPKHLSDLINSLVSFEIYSAECESKNEQDANLHAYLHATSAQSRAILEDALAHVIKHENIKI
ncbi:MAG: MerR family transcriptional regulator [Gammaproteobacteria bacterium]|nr:MerR family transcriptional regulator [Gammaproteobacteria bacterium]